MSRCCDLYGIYEHIEMRVNERELNRSAPSPSHFDRNLALHPLLNEGAEPGWAPHDNSYRRGTSKLRRNSVSVIEENVEAVTSTPAIADVMRAIDPSLTPDEVRCMIIGDKLDKSLVIESVMWSSNIHSYKF